MEEIWKGIVDRVSKIVDGAMGFTENLGQLALNTTDAVAARLGMGGDRESSGAMAETSEPATVNDTVSPGAASRAPEEKTVPVQSIMASSQIASTINSLRDWASQRMEGMQDYGKGTEYLASMDLPAPQATLPTGRGAPARGGAMPTGGAGAFA